MVFSIFAFASRATWGQVPKLMSCHGDLQVFGTKGASFSKFNPKLQGFIATGDQAFTFQIASDPDRPYVIFTPWIGIQYTLHPENYKKDLTVEVESDSETFISVKVTGRKSKVARTISCSVRVDDLSPRGSAARAPSPPKKTKTKREKATVPPKSKTHRSTPND